jgi:phage shock protein C
MNPRNRPFELDLQRKRFLGVCAGLADYMDVPVVLVRVIVVLACITWPTLVLVYFLAYWWVKPDGSGKVRTYVSATRTAEHFRSLNYRKPLYRGRDVKVAGVCSGIAEYLELRARTVRILAVLSFFIAGPFTFFVYGVLWIALEKAPQDVMGVASRRPRDSREDDGGIDSTQQQADRRADRQADNAMSVRECAAALQGVEARLRDVEAFITSRRFRLHCEIKRI